MDGQGILLPRANVPHLMLRKPVRDAVAAGKFRVVALDHVDQAIELLSGMPAGERDAEGGYPEGTFNRRVDERLRELAEIRRRVDRSRGEERDEDGGHGDTLH